MRQFQGYMTKGMIQNSHYNLVDTLRQFMPNWNEYVKAIIALVEIDYSKYLVFPNVGTEYPSIAMSAIQDLAQSDILAKAIPFDIQIRYTICECVVWAYLNSGYGLEGYKG
jgi:hypothetical protein